MTDNFWRPSDEQKRTILLMEALGLIHDLGKMSDLMLKSREPSSTVKYGYNLLSDPQDISIYKNYTNIANDPITVFIQEILSTSTNQDCAFGERLDINDILKSIKFTWINEKYSFAELMPLLAQTTLSLDKTADWNGVFGKSMQPGLLIGYLHGVSHVDKEGDPQGHEQPYSDVFRATPFGDEEQVGTDGVKELTIAFQNLPLNDLEKIITPQRSEWLEQMKALMKRGLADNRRPYNEVSLWDWGYSVATFAKSATNYIFKNGWPLDVRKLPFRTLRINLDILEYYTHSDKISDLLGIKQVIDDAFKKVQTLVEETYALGNQIYRDETGDYYLLPDIFNEIEQIEIRQEIQALFPIDLCPRVYFSNAITTNEIHDVDTKKSQNPHKLIAEIRTQALAEKAVDSNNNLYLFEKEWQNGLSTTNSEICTVCGIRPIGYPRHSLQSEIKEKLSPWAKEKKAKDRNICRICLDRRGRRSEQWLNRDLDHTIWTDEIADDQGHLALFIGKLGLEGWLDGKLLSTIKVTNNLTKHPSAARLYRIAETASAFWQKVTDELMHNAVGKRPFRLEIYPNSDDLLELGDYHAYDLDVDGIILSLVWDKPNSRFLTTDNLNYFSQKVLDKIDDDLVKNLRLKLEGKVFKIFESSSFLKSTQEKTEITVKKVELADSYLPAISLLTEPSLCLMLIPADKALKLAHQVKEEYEKQMVRVRDRLPLDIGLIFFKRSSPIRSVLEAARAMLNFSGELNMDSGKGWEGWRLMNKQSLSGFCQLEFDNGINWKIPTVAGDGTKQDEWYPRLYQGNSWQTDGKSQRKVKHIGDLNICSPTMPKDKGHRVWVRPSHFDSEYLDSTARRFDIHYDKNGRRPRKTRPFYLEDLDRFQKLWEILQNLETSQCHQVIYTIEATRELWYGEDIKQTSWKDSVFKQFVTDTLGNAAWIKDYKKWTDIPQEDRQQLIDAGVRGELADIADLYMEILKER